MEINSSICPFHSFIIDVCIHAHVYLNTHFNPFIHSTTYSLLLFCFNSVQFDEKGIDRWAGCLFNRVLKSGKKFRVENSAV